MNHSQYMVNLSLSDENWCSGHALMVTCPPRDFCEKHGMEVEFDPKEMMADLPKPDLVKMLQLSSKLTKMDDQVTPVMAWAWIMGHPRCGDLGESELQTIRDELRPRVNCYGFGAVLEDFEVRDVIEKVLESKDKKEESEDLDEMET